MIELATSSGRGLRCPPTITPPCLQSQVNDAIVARTSGMIAGGKWWEVEWEVLTEQQGVARTASLGTGAFIRGACSSDTELIDIAPQVGASPGDRAPVEFAQSLNASRVAGRHRVR